MPGISDVTTETSHLLHPVFQHQAWYPLKLSPVPRHHDGAGGDGMSVDRRVVWADRRPGQPQHHFNLRGSIDRGVVPGQNGIEAGAERVSQLQPNSVMISTGTLNFGSPELNVIRAYAECADQLCV